MMSGEPFLPLYFEEEDQDLWQVLASIPPENRAGVVKTALRQAFSLNHENLNRDHVSDERIGHNHVSVDRVEHDMEFTLEDLFVPAASASAENQQEAVRSDAGPAAGHIDSLSPWDNLLYNIIGTEDDEAVIAAIQKSAL